MRQIILKLIIIAVAWYLSMLLLIYFHECVHVAIYKVYGCYAYFMIDPLGLSGETHVMSNCELSIGGYFLHALNDVIGYTLVAILCIVYLNAIFIVITKHLFSR